MLDLYRYVSRWWTHHIIKFLHPPHWPTPQPQLWARSHAKDQALQKSSWPKRSHLKTVLQHIELHLVVSDVAFHSITVFQRSHPTNRKLPGSRFTEPGRRPAWAMAGAGLRAGLQSCKNNPFCSRHFFLTSRDRWSSLSDFMWFLCYWEKFCSECEVNQWRQSDGYFFSYFQIE